MTWPLAVHAQKDTMKRVGPLLNLAADDPESQARGNSAGSAGNRLGNVAEVVGLAPDVIFASTNQVMVPLQQATRSMPIVFAAVTDSVAGGFVASLARPGRNATGFTSAEYGMSPKWLELLKDVAPRVTRAAVLFDTNNPGGLLIVPRSTHSGNSSPR
jgi:putative ABC transport system substrate-binding protein